MMNCWERPSNYWMPINNEIQGDHFHMNVHVYVSINNPLGFKHHVSAGGCWQLQVYIKFILHHVSRWVISLGKFSIAFSQDVSSQRGDDGGVVEQSHMRWKSTNEKWVGNLLPPPNVTPRGIAGRSGLIYHWFALMRPCLNPCFSGWPVIIKRINGMVRDPANSSLFVFLGTTTIL